MYLTEDHHSPFSQIGPVHPVEQTQLPLRHVPPFSHGMRQKSVQKFINDFSVKNYHVADFFV